MVSLARTVRSIRRVGLRAWWRQMQYIGDAKSGRYVGSDQFNNRYFENMNAEEEVPGAFTKSIPSGSLIWNISALGRQRWVDFAQHEYNASQIPPEWHSWLQHIRKDAPPQDSVIAQVTPPWKAPYIENLTGTRGAYKPYNTVKPKISAWEPQAKTRA